MYMARCIAFYEDIHINDVYKTTQTDGLVQDCCIFIANALQILQSCT